MIRASAAASPAERQAIRLDSETALVPEEILATSRADSRGMFRDLAALVLDRHLRRLVRIRQPVDLRVGRLLLRLETSSGYLTLGFARLSDYATERLGLPARRVQTLLALARRLVDLPRLAAAFDAGTVSLSQVRLLLRVATAANEAEWIERAGAMTVRRLEVSVRAAVAEAPGEEAENGDEDVGRPDAADGGDVAADAVLDDDAVAGEVIGFDAPASMRARWEQALELARRSAGASDPAWRSVEFIVADYLSGVTDLASLLAPTCETSIGGGPDRSAASLSQGAWRSPCTGADLAPGESPGRAGTELFEEVLAGLEAEAGVHEPAIPATGPAVILPDSVNEMAGDSAVDLDARLRELIRLRQSVSWNIGRLLRLVADRRLYRELGFMSLARFCRERLGLGARRAWLLIGLERRLVVLPGITQAYRSGVLSWVKAAALARVASEVSEQRWMRLAAAVTVRRLLEEVALAESEGVAAGPRGIGTDGRVQLSTPTRHSPEPGSMGTQAPGADRAPGANPAPGDNPVPEDHRAPESFPRTRIRFWAPYEVASLWHEALRVCRARAGRPLEDWQCVASILAAFLDTWGVRTDPAWSRRYRIFERDGWRCRVPGCTSRSNLQVHHIEFRSQGGSDDAANLAVLCATHHLQGIHRNRLRCHALPDGLLAWEFSPDPIRGPLVRYVEDVEWSAARAAAGSEAPG